MDRAIKIIEASEVHLPAIADLFKLSIESIANAYYSPKQINAWTSKSHHMDRWRHRLETQYFLVAVMGDQIAGMGSIDENGYIDVLYVHPQFKRQGISTMILKKLKQQSSEVSSWSTDASEAARPFFERHGFLVEKKNDLEIDGVAIHNYRMVLRNG